MHECKKGIKHDPALFPKLQHDTAFHSFQCKFEIQAHSQHLGNIINITYIPNTNPENDLFDAQQKYMISVLEAKLLIDTGKSIVSKHVSNFDGQKIYVEIVDHFTSPTKAKADTESILDYSITSYINDGKWNGTVNSHILN